MVLAAAVFRPYRGNLPLAEDAASDLEYLCEQWARHLWIDTPAPGMVVTTERRSVKRVGQEARRPAVKISAIWFGISASFVNDLAADRENAC
ncbi:MAG: hypothetical protein P8164_07575 [Gammaproteobacteria bacterium]